MSPGWSNSPQRQEQMPDSEGVWVARFNSTPSALPVTLVRHSFYLVRCRHLTLCFMGIFLPSPLFLCVLLGQSCLCWRMLPWAQGPLAPLWAARLKSRFPWAWSETGHERLGFSFPACLPSGDPAHWRTDGGYSPPSPKSKKISRP